MMRACDEATFDGAADLHAVLNMYWEALDFEVPVVPGRRWYRVVDTARPSPEDIVETARQVPIEGDHRGDASQVV
jgi:glycogen operon protein